MIGRVVIWIVAGLLAAGHAAEVADPGWRVWTGDGWALRDGALVGQGGAVAVSAEDATDAEATPDGVEPDDVGAERAALEAEAEARGVDLDVTAARILPSALGEPRVLLEYSLTSRVEGEVAPARGLRLVRRCGATVRLTLEGEAPELALLNEADGQVLWTLPDCARFNRRSSSASADAVGLPPPPPPRPPPPPPEPSSPLWPLAGLAAVVIAVASAARRRREAAAVRANPVPEALRPLAERSPTAHPRPAAPPPRPPDGPLPAPLAPAGGPPQHESDEDEGDSLAFRDALGDALRALDDAVGADRVPLPLWAAADVPPAFAELLRRRGGARWGGGWLTLAAGRPGDAVDVATLTATARHALGDRVAIGWSGFGALVALDPSGGVEIVRPPGGPRARTRLSLAAWLGALAEDGGARRTLADPATLAQAASVAGPLGPDEVYVSSGGAWSRVSVLACWSADG